MARLTRFGSASEAVALADDERGLIGDIWFSTDGAAINPNPAATGHHD
jgi:hypothetical protein